jgi:hypothetical protein
MGHRLDKRDVGANHIPKSVLRISGRGCAEHLDARALTFNLAAQLLEYFDRIRDRVAF